MKPKLVVLTGAGISAESGLKTFRDSDGLWEGYNVGEVATFDGWKRNPELVLKFYNERRKAVRAAQPNAAHKALVELENKYDLTIVTQNIDNLHERAGSSKIVHLHGEILKSQSTLDESLVYDIEGWELKLGDKCPKGSQLRPHVVWFGESVPKMDQAIELARAAEILIIIGTSLVVYPAASLIDFVPRRAKKYLVDPSDLQISEERGIIHINERATVGVPKLVSELGSLK